jgi:Flp pilus assembly protein TadG
MLEFAIVAPLFLFLLCALLDFGRLFFVLGHRPDQPQNA